MGKKILDSKLLYALLAIVIAIGLWFYVAVVENSDEDTKTTISNIPITFVNVEVLEAGNLMISEGFDQTATLTVVGPRTTLANLDMDKEKISLTVDVSKITSPGSQRMAYSINLPSGYASSVTVMERYPNNVDFTVSRRIDKEIEIEGKFVGTLAEGYMRDEFVFVPGKIGITGIESEVNRISHALVTVGGEDLTTTVRGVMGFELIDFQGEVLSDLDVTLTTETVSVTMPVIQTADIPLVVKWIAGGGISNLDEMDQFVRYSIEPEMITVSGAEEDLEPLKEIVLGEIKLANIVGSDTFEFEIPLNSSLENISGNTKAKVEVTIYGLENKVVEVDNIEMIRIPDGFVAESVTQTLQVLLRGPSDFMELVLPHNLRVVADLSDLDEVPGRYTVPVRVYLDGTRDVGVVRDDYKIVVDLTEAGEQK